MGREVLLLAPALLLLGAACREESTPEPKNRAEANELERKGHSFAAKTRPGWVDEPRPATPAPAARAPAGWAQAGRGAWMLGQLTLPQLQALGELSGDPATLAGKRVKVRAPIRSCAGSRSLAVLEENGQALVCLLAGELPAGADGKRAVVEGELRRASGDEAKAAGRCLGKESAPLVLHASGVLVHLPGSGR